VYLLRYPFKKVGAWISVVSSLASVVSSGYVSAWCVYIANLGHLHCLRKTLTMIACAFVGCFAFAVPDEHISVSSYGELDQTEVFSACGFVQQRAQVAVKIGGRSASSTSCFGLSASNTRNLVSNYFQVKVRALAHRKVG
jgi:hypothetical protein